MLPLIKAVALSLALLAISAGTSAAQEFYGDLTLRPLDGQKMEVRSIFGFTDKAGRKWEVPVGHKTDGASIPWQLWSIVGSPFTGKYLKAAVIHDFYCDLKSREWRDVHHAFYDAMILDGVGKTPAKVMFAAVLRFGPRWVVDKYFECPPGNRCYYNTPTYVDWMRIQPRPRPDAMEELKRLVEEGDLSLEEVGRLADNGFLAEKSSDFEISGRVFRYSGSVKMKGQWVDHTRTILSGSHGDFRPQDKDRETISRIAPWGWRPRTR